MNATEESQVVMINNKGTIHYFTQDQETCMCGSTHHTDYTQKQKTVKKPAAQILENPATDLLGSPATNGLRKLEKQVVQSE